MGDAELVSGRTHLLQTHYLMDLLHAADELKNVAHSSMLVVQAWRAGATEGLPDALTDALTELESELIRVEEV